MIAESALMDRLEQLRQRYALSLPDKADQLTDQWIEVRREPCNRAALTDVHQQVHRLSGSAPAYGFEALGAIAQEIDNRIATWLNAGEHDAIETHALLESLQPRIEALLRALLAREADPPLSEPVRMARRPDAGRC
jgi:HPt (histidine-containing phosphotransfer) domain-containing protein